MRLIDIAALAAVVGPAFVQAKHLTPECLAVVYQRMEELNVHSWENGTRGEANLEWVHPQLSVFGTKGNFFPQGLTSDNISDIMEIANDAMDQRPTPVDRTNPNNITDGNSTDSADDTDSEFERRFVKRLRYKRQDSASSSISLPSATLSASATSSGIPEANKTCAVTPAQMNRQLPPGSPLVNGAGAAGDPPSLGIPVLLANRTTGGAVRNHSTYGDAAASQLNFLLYHVPRASNGAISHRECSMQLWADNVYMVPPFLAYYGATTNNKTVVTEAYNQIKAYREILQDPTTKLWKHMSVGWEADDYHIWSTGNAWVVAGTARVIATIQQSSFASEMTSEVNDLSSWANEIFTASKVNLTSNGFLRNYPTNESSFEDSASTALMAAAGLRYSTMNITNDYVDMSLTMLAAASRNVNATGFLTQVVNPMTFKDLGKSSPEGQSFIILAYAAYNDWYAAGQPGGDSKNKDPLADSDKTKSSANRVVAGTLVAAFAGALSLVLA